MLKTHDQVDNTAEGSKNFDKKEREGKIGSWWHGTFIIRS